MDPLYSTLLHAAYWGYVLLLVAAAAFDAWKYIIPNTIPVALSVLFVATALVVPLGTDWTSHIAAGFGALLGGLAIYRFNIIGAGDIKLISAVALWTGIDPLPIYVLYVGIGGGLLAISLLILRRLLQGLLVLVPASENLALPRVLLSGEKIPYGIAAAGAAILIATAGWLPHFDLLL